MKNDNAFPMVVSEPAFATHRGLTKREWMAGLAMQGLLASLSTVHSGELLRQSGEYFGDSDACQTIARAARKHTDALIAELEK